MQAGLTTGLVKPKEGSEARMALQSCLQCAGMARPLCSLYSHASSVDVGPPEKECDLGLGCFLLLRESLKGLTAKSNSIADSTLGSWAARFPYKDLETVSAHLSGQ